MSSGAEVTCRCPPQASGPRCERLLPCASPALPCLNGGSCSPLTGTCLCPLNATGERCETSLPCGGLPSASGPCLNGGVCLMVSAPLGQGGVGFRCVCPAAYAGVLCETSLAALCTPGACLNGGTCVQSASSGVAQVSARLEFEILARLV